MEDVYAIGDRIGVTETPLGKIGIDICADNSLNSLSIAITLGRMCADMILSPCAWAVKSDYNIETEPYGKEWAYSIWKDFQNVWDTRYWCKQCRTGVKGFLVGVESNR